MDFSPEDIALITLCPEGLASARRLRERYPEAALYLHQTVSAQDAQPFTRMAELSQDLWKTKRGLVYFAPSGAVLRSIAPLVESKYSDPAIVVCDVHARWAISLLSGHEGGANDLTLSVANHLEAEPVITTTSEAVKDLIVGLGCRRGCPEGDILDAIRQALERCNMAMERVRYIASADIKADEVGLLAASRTLAIPLRLLSKAQLLTCMAGLSPSPAAERHLGVPGVAEPCALLAGFIPQLLLPRTVIKGCTVAVAMENTHQKEIHP